VGVRSEPGGAERGGIGLVLGRAHVIEYMLIGRSGLGLGVDLRLWTHERDE